MRFLLLVSTTIKPDVPTMLLQHQTGYAKVPDNHRVRLRWQLLGLPCHTLSLTGPALGNPRPAFVAGCWGKLSSSPGSPPLDPPRHQGLRWCCEQCMVWRGTGQAARRAAAGAASEGPTGRRRFWHCNHGCRIASTPLTAIYHFVLKAEARCKGTTAQKLTEVASDGAGLVE